MPARPEVPTGPDLRWEPLGFTLSATRPDAQWHAEIDSYDPASPAGTPARHAGEQVTVGPRAVVVHKNPRPVAPLP